MKLLNRLRFRELMARGLENLSPAEKAEAISLTFEYTDHLMRTNPAELAKTLQDLAEADPAYIEAGIALMKPAIAAAESAAPDQFSRDIAWFKTNIETTMGTDSEQRTIQ